MLSTMFSILPAQAAAGDLTVTMTAPVNQPSVGESVYQITDPVNLDNIYFCWNFSNGIDTNLDSNLQQISLKTKGGENVTLSSDNFTYTKEDTPVKLRQLELALDSTALVADTDYIIEFGPEIAANNGTDTLGQIYSWEFKTGTEENPEPPASTAPTWPEGAEIETSNIDATSVTLKWIAAQDTTGVTGYKIYQDGEEIESVNGSTLCYDVSGLISATEYTFKIEAGNADDSWSQDGPSVQVTTGGGGQLLIEQFNPSASEKSSNDTLVYYTVNEFIAPDKVHFAWNFSNGLDSNLIANLEKISLIKKSDNTSIIIDQGEMTQDELDLNTSDIVTLGDFTYTKQQSPKLRQIELNLSQTLEAATTYVIKMAPDIESNSGGKLGRSFCWEFTTTDPGDLTPPTWPESKQVTATQVTPDTVTLQWTAAQDNVVVAGYKILQDGDEVQTVDSSTTTCEIDGLTPDTEYSFKIEAVDGNGNQSTDGPSITVTTIEADITAPTWPEGSELTITNAAAPALVLHWTEAADDWGLAGYQVYQDGQLLGSVDNNTLRFHVTGLMMNKSYNFMIKAVDNFDNCSESGPNLDVVLEREDNTSPIWPKNSGWSISNTTVFPKAMIFIQWGTPMDDTGIFAYRIYQNDVLIAEVDESVHNYSLELPFDNQSYTYRIAAGDAAGNWGLHPSDLVMYTGDPNEDLEAPTWPAGTVISASEITDSTLKIQWTAAEDNKWIEMYSIMMDGNYVYSTNIGEVKDNTSFPDRTCLFDINDCKNGYGYSPEELMPGTEHEFYIKAYDRNLNGRISPKIKVTLGGSPTMGAALGPLGKKGFSITAPECINASVDNITEVNNRVINPVDPANVYFCWDFSADLKPATDSMYMDNVILKNKLTGEIINLTPEDFVITQNDIPNKVRRFELKLKQVLQDQTTYILTLKKDFRGQILYDGRLARDFNWEFTTAVADSEKPTWPVDAQLALSSTPTSLTLTWPAANDNVAVTGYEIVKTENGNDEVLAAVDSNTTAYIINDLTVNTGYSFKVRARDYVGNRSDYLEVSGTTAGTDTTTPAWNNKSLTCSEVAASSLVLNWEPAQDDWGVVAYNIYQNGQEIARVDAKDNSYRVEGLLPTNEYTFKVEAGDAFNNWSSDGPETTIVTTADTTVPSWPEDSTLTRIAVSSDSVTLTWTAANDDVAVTSYKIFQNGTPVQDIEGSTTCTIDGLTANTEYVFKVEAVDAAMNCSSDGPSLTQWTTPQDMAAPAHRLAMGYFHTLLLRDDGSLWAWGENQYGQLGDGTTTDRSQPVEIQAITGIKSVAAGRNHSIALKEDGTVWAWGNDTLVPTQVPGLSGIIGIGSGDFQSFAFDENGNIWTLDSAQPVQVGQLEGVMAIAGGRYHTLALKNDRTVWAWGDNYTGATGTGSQEGQYSSPVEIPGLNGIVQIDAMVDNSAVVKSDGTVWTFGQNQYGQLGDGTTETSFSPIQVPNLNEVKTVAVAKYHMAVLKDDGSVWSWGFNGNGRLGNGTEEDSRIPVQAVNVSDISMFATGEWDTVAIKSNGAIMAWGGRLWSSFYPTNIGIFRTPVLNVAPGNRLVNQAVDISFEDNADWRTNISQITVDGVALSQDQYTLSAGILAIDAVIFDKAKDYGVVIKALGYDDASITIRVMSEITQETVSFDENTRNLALTDQVTAVTITSPAAVADAKISLVNFLPAPASGAEMINSTALPALTVEASTAISTRPVKLEIPQGTTINAPLAWDGIMNVPTLKTNDSISIMGEEAGNPAKVTCVLEIGSNDVPLKFDRAVRILIPGQAGKEVGYYNGPYFTKITRVCAEDDQTWADANIPSGSDARMNVGNDLIIWTKHLTTFVTYYWAANSTPVIVNNLSAGGGYSMFLDSDGSLWTWGRKEYGVLGPEAITDRIVPMKAEGLDDFISVSAGAYHNMGLKADGTVWTWGRNHRGQLGYAEPESTDIPLQVPGISHVAFIVCGDQWSVAVKKDGTVWTWGGGGMGQLGDGTRTQICPNPVQVEGLTDVLTVATGGERNLAIKKDGTVWGWGRQLGKEAAHLPATTPVQLEGLTGVVAVDAGWGGQLAVKDDGTVWSWVPDANRVFVPQQFEITDVKTISIKRGNAFAVKNDGTVWSWEGENYTSPPTQVEGLYGIIAIEPREYDVNYKFKHVLALREDGVIVSWGDNANGQLGNGTNIASPALTQALFDTGIIAPQWPDKTLTSSDLGQNSLTLTWSSAIDDICAAVYRIYQNDQIIGEVAGYTTAFNVIGLEAGTVYSFKIEACDGAGNWSSDGPVLEATTAPLLAADSTNNIIGQPICITFTDNAAWRTAISQITVGGAVIEPGKFQVDEGKITINAEAFAEAKDYEIVVKATGYLDVAVTQTINTEVVIPLIPPALTADSTDNTIGQAIEITFTDVADWKDVITDVTVDGSSISGQYSVSAGKITIDAGVFDEAKDYVIIVKATGYADASITQTINSAPAPVPAPKLLSGEITSKGDLSLTFDKEMADPAGIQGQFTVTVDGATVAVSGVETTNTVEKIKLVLSTKATGANHVTISYAKSTDPAKQLKSADGGIVESFGTQIGEAPALNPPALEKDASDNHVGNPVDITFNDDVIWRDAISDVTIDGTSISGQYSVSAGKITIAAGLFTEARDYEIAVKATGYSDAGVIQKMHKVITGSSVTVDEGNKNLAVTGSTPATTVTIPESVDNATINVGELLNAPAGGEVQTGALPALTITADTSIDAAPVQVEIPAGTTVSAPEGWDGTINVPSVRANNSVAVTPDEGKTATVKAVIEVGFGDVPLTFSQAVKLVIPGQAGKDVGYFRNGAFTPITNVCATNSQAWADANLPAGGDGKVDDGQDLVIWTKHFTLFAAYEQSATGNNGGGGGGGGSGSGTSGGLTVSFNKAKLSPTDTLLQFDFGNGIDSTLDSNLSKIKVYEKNTGSEVQYSDYNYIKQGQGDDAVKIRRLELMFDNLKSGTIYVVELAAGFEANNGSTLGAKKSFEFTTTGTAAAAGGAGPAVEQGIGTAGGTINEYGAIIVIPAASFNQSIKVAVQKITDVSDLPMAAKSILASDVIEITKDQDGSFDKAVTITLTFDKSKVDTSKYDLIICYLNEKENRWIALDNIKVDLAAATVSGEIKHFTKFAVIAVEKAQASLPLSPGELVTLSDIQEHWAQPAIAELISLGAIGGYPDGTFKPDQGISRAEFASILVKALQLEQKQGKVFNDTAGHWAQDAIATAAAYGIVNGYSDTSFGPDDSITREQMAVMVVKAAKLAEVEEGKAFADGNKISAWAGNAVATASQNQIINGYPDNTFRPQNNASRAEAATVIVKSLQLAA